MPIFRASGFASLSVVLRCACLYNPKKKKKKEKKIRDDIDSESYKLCEVLLELFFVFQVPMNEMDFNILWMGNHPKPDILRNLMPHQKVNHFPRYVSKIDRSLRGKINIQLPQFTIVRGDKSVESRIKERSCVFIVVRAENNNQRRR